MNGLEGSSQHIGEYSPDGKYHAYINSEGKLKIWDIQTSELKQDYIPNVHLSSPCTVLTWVKVKSGNAVKKGTKKHKVASEDLPDQNTLYIAIGTNKGGVSLYNLATGKIEIQLSGEGHSGAITGISYQAPEILYTCGQDCRIVVWNISEQKQVASWHLGKEKPSCISVIPGSNMIAVGSRQIQLWSSESLSLMQTFTGHVSNVSQLKTLVSGKKIYLLSGSKTDRTLSLWQYKKSSSTPSKSKSKVISECFQYLMEDIPNTISCCSKDDTLEILAVTRSGVAHYYSKSFEDLSTTKPNKPKITIKIVSDCTDVVQLIPTLTATLEFVNDNAKETLRNAIIGYGDTNFMRFEFMEIDLSLTDSQALIRSDPKKFATKATTKGKILKTVTPGVNEEGVEFVQPAMALTKRTKNVEIPMETRLENLSVTPGETPQMTNKAQLLIQALHSRDQQLLREAITITDERVIRNTIQKLPAQYIGPLVNELTYLAQKKTVNIKIAVSWLKILVELHASQLMAWGNEEIFDKFGPLLGIIELRTETLKSLSRIRGRLDLLVNQIKRNVPSEENLDSNYVVYEDEDSSASDEEFGNDSSAEEQWSEDVDLDDDDDDEDEDENGSDAKMDMSD